MDSVERESRNFVPSGLSWLSVYIPDVFHKTGNAVMEIRIQMKRHKNFRSYLMLTFSVVTPEGHTIGSPSDKVME